MEKRFYIQKVEKLLNDKDSYTVVKKNPIKTIENNLNDTLKKWLQKDLITK